jgi:hypothetical protein
VRDDVGVRHHAVERVARLLLLEVEDDAQLVPVGPEEDAALFSSVDGKLRIMSPAGASILMTSAPRSASSVQP